MDSIIQTITVLAIPVLFAITLHEAAHGYVARHFGDPTADLAGRISLNPMRHIDPVGTIAVPLFLLFTAKLMRSEEHTSELQSRGQLVCRLLLEKKNPQEPLLHTIDSPNADTANDAGAHRLAYAACG